MLSFGRYILSAGAATVVDFVLVQSLLTFALFQSGVYFGVAVALGALAGMSVNFALSRRFVFRIDERAAGAQLRSFLVISFTTLMLRVIVAYALLALLGLPLFAFVGAMPVPALDTRLAHLGAAGLVTIYSFFAHKHVSFGGGVRFWLLRFIPVR